MLITNYLSPERMQRLLDDPVNGPGFKIALIGIPILLVIAIILIRIGIKGIKKLKKKGRDNRLAIQYAPIIEAKLNDPNNWIETSSGMKFLKDGVFVGEEYKAYLAYMALRAEKNLYM